jgi:hypothetical protein
LLVDEEAGRAAVEIEFPSVPSLFRQTPISTTKRREPMGSETWVPQNCFRLVTEK